MNVQEFLGDVQVDGAVKAESAAISGGLTAQTTRLGATDATTLTATRVTAESVRIGTPTRVFVGEQNLSVTVSSGTVYFIGCGGTVNTSGTGAKTLYLQGSPGLIVNNNGNAKTYRDGVPVGGIVQSTAADSPAAYLGGNWEKLTDDAYLKIVTTGAGTSGGTSATHIIPLTSMPSHKHILEKIMAGANGVNADGYTTQRGYSDNAINIAVPAQFSITSAGGGQPYYPYYYGVYVWRRLNVAGKE